MPQALGVGYFELLVSALSQDGRIVNNADLTNLHFEVGMYIYTDNTLIHI